MKFTKISVLAGTLLVLLGLGTSTTVLASEESNPIFTNFAARVGTWTITSVNVPAWGGGSSTHGKSNLKKTNSNSASFNGDAFTNSFGYTVHLVNNKNQRKSDFTGLYINRTTYGNNNSGIKGYHYWSDVHSKAVEYSNSNVKLHFSSDRK